MWSYGSRHVMGIAKTIDDVRLCSQLCKPVEQAVGNGGNYLTSLRKTQVWSTTELHDPKIIFKHFEKQLMTRDVTVTYSHPARSKACVK